MVIKYKSKQETLLSAPREDFKDAVREAIKSIHSRKYWSPTRKVFDKQLEKIVRTKGIPRKTANLIILDYLTDILKKSEPQVMGLIEQSGKDVRQSRVSVAGNNFQALVAHSLLTNVLAGNLPKLKIALKQKKHPLVEKYCVIKVGGEKQKPDMDVLIYSERKNSPLVICSCKTSLRERAGQTYRWKLLMDLAITSPKHLRENPDCPINKYNIEYKSDRKVYVVMITADLYKEALQPQQRGMFAFFDSSFITDKREKFPPNVLPMSKIIQFLNKVYRA